jgi:hypothetical protein
MGGNGSNEHFPDSGVIVVSQSRAQARGLFGFLAVAFAAALARGVTGASTTTGRVAVSVLLGLLLAGAVVLLATAGKRLDHLEVDEDQIRYVVWNGQQRSVLAREWGSDLRFVRRAAGRFYVNCLNIRGTDKIISLPLFSNPAVRRACVARGWHFPARR